MAILLALAGCGWWGDRAAPPAVDEAPASVEIMEAGARLYVSVPGGTVVRREPESASGAIDVLPREVGALEVLEIREPWLRVQVGEVEGWLRSEPSWKRFQVSAPPRTPRLAEAAAPEVLAAARRIMGPAARQGRCGTYPLITDLSSGRATERLLTSCDALARQLDAAYERRTGLRPVGDPAATLLLFRRREDFRTFSRQQGGPRLGYGAYSRPGLVAMFADPEALDYTLETLVHEMTHRIHRRALGGELPRWLSEGLADLLGDSAGVSGLDPLRGFLGVEDEAARLVSAVAAGRAGSVRRLVDLQASEFDAEPTALDYEQSALLVRFLLLHPERAPRFKAYLGEMSRGRRFRPEELRAALDWSWEEWDEAFAGWLLSGGR